MYCTRCGYQMPDDAKMCPACGSMQGPQQGSQQNNSNYGNGYQSNPFPPTQMDPDSEKKFKNMLIWTIIELVCCSRLFGAISLFLIISGKNSYLRGDYQKYEKNTSLATTLLIVGLVIGLVCGGAYAGLSFLTAFYQ